jgi:hypothetical protein
MALSYVIVQDLTQFFRPLVERSFIEDLGWPDFAAADYLTELLVNFSQVDHVYAMKQSMDSFEGRLDSSLLDEQVPESEEAFYRHIGDVILFTVGLFPDTLCQIPQEEGFPQEEILAQYMAVGREAYHRVSQLKEVYAPEEAELFEKLAENFLLCSFCLDGIGETLQEQHRKFVQDSQK